MASALPPFHPKLRGLPEGVPNVVDERTLQMRANFTLDLEGEYLDLWGWTRSSGAPPARQRAADEREPKTRAPVRLAIAGTSRAWSKWV